MMINENGTSTTESIIINCLNSSDALVIIDNQLNNNINCPTISFPMNTNFLDLCNFVEVQQISTFPDGEQQELPALVPNQTYLNSPDSTNSSTSTTNNVASSEKTIDETDDQDGYESESELTNLNWLTELKNITNLSPPDLPVTDQPTTRFNKFMTSVRKSHENFEKRRYIYATCCNEKPPFNYAQIIAMAMLEHGRMTLQGICKWIQERFAYYKTHKNWNNSIRHNLSLNFFFTKVARGKNEKGKGGYWELAMDTSKSHRKRLRRNRNGKHKNNILNSCNKNRTRKSLNKTTTTHKDNTQFMSRETKVPDSDMPNREQEEDEHQQSIASDEELLNNIAANITAQNQNQDSNVYNVGATSLISTNEIYFADEIPQSITDDIILSSTSTTNTISTVTTTSSTSSVQVPVISDGPSVIVEYLPTMDTFDENELNGLINLNEQELIDRFLNCGDDHEIFVN
uniref:CSON004906 protein n=1 Tax=Culicoides sonorensis TaxID=179676 RepID=A0A336MVV8_CULSO